MAPNMYLLILLIAGRARVAQTTVLLLADLTGSPSAETVDEDDVSGWPASPVLARLYCLGHL
jgi:hypothetical protein